MLNAYSYGYLKDAVKAHLDLEEDELDLQNINNRFHFFANEAIQYITDKRPKALYFYFSTVAKLTPLVYDNGVLREATTQEQAWLEYGLPEPNFASEDEIVRWHNSKGVYLVGQVISMPDNFAKFADKRGYIWTTDITAKITLDKQYLWYVSNSEIVALAIANYAVPYYATWLTFGQDDEDDAIVAMPSDLALTIPIYVASCFLQQRNLSMANAKRQEFELAVSRCQAPTFLPNKEIKPSFV